MKPLIGIWFVLVCCSFGIGLLVFDSINRAETSDSHPVVRQSGCEYEVWIDEKTGHRFLVATRKWNIGGVGVCLIPDVDGLGCPVEEEAVPDPAFADNVILESTAGWKDIQ